MIFKLVIDKSAEETVVATVHKRSALTDQLETMVMQYSGEDRIAAYPVFPGDESRLSSRDEIRMLPFSEMECITILDGKTYAIDVRGQRYRLKQRLYELEERLPACFIRINKSALANETRLVRFTASFSGAVNAVFQCGYTEYVSRRCFAAIKRRYEAQ